MKNNKINLNFLSLKEKKKRKIYLNAKRKKNNYKIVFLMQFVKQTIIITKKETSYFNLNKIKVIILFKKKILLKRKNFCKYLFY